MMAETKAREATQKEIREALMMVLSTLPVGAEFRFFWRDGVQHMAMKFGAEPERLMSLNRRADGIGIPTPVHH